MFNSDNHDWITENPDTIYNMYTYIYSVNKIYQRNLSERPIVSIWPSTTWRRNKKIPKRFQVYRTGKEREGERAEMATSRDIFNWKIVVHICMQTICTYIYTMYNI